ncbi:hypothetical protein NQ314_009775 [Rhamnusium bicolor]|uniref:Uncharacterized protein n=1 Tax=Rhamnusium bicolor TaxID=1586634 RepID=A0AAV8XWT4_9CUCU|nr:hypothetical protein NQ314_009775 [Rhamnusium bicolor]
MYTNVIFLLALASANAGLILRAPKFLEGPSSKTKVVGPDGSVISAFAPGGKILLEDNHGPLLQAAPEVVATAGVAQPLPLAETQVVEEVSPAIIESRETILVDTGVAKAAPEKLVQSEGLAETSTETATEAEPVTAAVVVATVDSSKSVEKASKSLELVETETESTTAKNIPETPVSVVPLSKGLVPVVVKTVQNPAALSFIHDSPFYVPEHIDFEGHYVPDNFEHAFADGAYNHASFDW